MIRYVDLRRLFASYTCDEREMSELNNAKLVTVAEFTSEEEAAILVSRLHDAGIRAVATGGFTAAFRAEAPGMVQVQTIDADEPAARRILEQIRPSKSDC